MTNHSIESLTHWTAQILESCQVPRDDALQAAQLLVRSELRGYATHGMTRLPSYVERLLAKDFNPHANLRHREFPGGIVLDADGAMGQIAGAHAVRLGLQALSRAPAFWWPFSPAAIWARSESTHCRRPKPVRCAWSDNARRRCSPWKASPVRRSGITRSRLGAPRRASRRSSSTSPAAWRRADTCSSPHAKGATFLPVGLSMLKDARQLTPRRHWRARCCPWGATRASASR